MGVHIIGGRLMLGRSDHVRVSAEFTIAVLTEGWAAVPLLPSDVALVESSWSYIGDVFADEGEGAGSGAAASGTQKRRKCPLVHARASAGGFVLCLGSNSFGPVKDTRWFHPFPPRFCS